MASGVALPERDDRSGFRRAHSSRTKKFSIAGKAPTVSGCPWTGALSSNTCRWIR